MEAQGNIEKFKNRGIERHRAKSRNTFPDDTLIFYRLHIPRTQLLFDVHCQIRDNGEKEDARQYIAAIKIGRIIVPFLFHRNCYPIHIEI